MSAPQPNTQQAWYDYQRIERGQQNGIVAPDHDETFYVISDPSHPEEFPQLPVNFDNASPSMLLSLRLAQQRRQIKLVRHLEANQQEGAQQQFGFSHQMEQRQHQMPQFPQRISGQQQLPRAAPHFVIPPNLQMDAAPVQMVRPARRVIFQ